MERLRIAGAGDLGMIGRVTPSVILCLETSTPRGSIALLEGGGGVLFEASFTSERSHNAALFEPLERAMAALGGRPLGAVIVGTGPGSYSGTRVGIAAAQGIAMVHDCPAAGLSSLAAVACLETSPVALAIGDARRGNAWCVEVAAGKAVAAPKLLAAAELPAVLEARAELPVFALEEVSKLGLSQPVTLETPGAVRLGRAWLRLAEEERETLLATPPQPVYLQPPHITQAKGGHPLLAGRNGGAS